MISRQFRVVNLFWASLALLVLMTASPPRAYAEEGANELAAAFVSPPESARPWVYWFWLNGNITRDGITADLEAMKRVGIGGVLIMEVDQGAPRGPVDFMGDEWRDLFKHVVAEAHRLGMEVNMNNDAGWNGSGGPWIKPDQAMQEVVWSETNLEGPQEFNGTLSQPETLEGYYRDIAVQAFPTPGAYRIDNIDVKACFKTGFAGQAAPQDLPPEMVIGRDRIVDLTAKMEATGHLAWSVPPGKWTVMRFGHTCTGVVNAPAPESGRGLECDKLSKEGIEANFAGMMAKLVSDSGVTPAGGSALVATHIDSWENGAQSWTAQMREEFQRRRGYDPLPFLPAMSGRVVGSLEVSERFLWDLRQTISDLVVENYAGHMQTLAHEHGLRLSIEAYGGPCDDLPYAGQADEPMCEFWIGGNGFPTCKEMASAAHTYGRRILGAEAFTANDSERWLEHPSTMKALGDRAFCDGVNRFVFHRYPLQPWADRRPGMAMGPWGVHYERTQTWWEWTPGWHEYLARCQYLLRQGLYVADICYLQPEHAPQSFYGHSRNAYQFDNCSAEVVLTRMTVRDGRLALPDGMSYRLLALPDSTTMTPQLLRKIKELVQAGATVAGPRPARSPSLSGYPQCDQQVKELADEIWGDCDGNSVKEHRLGLGRVLWGIPPGDVLAQAGVQPDFASQKPLEYIHRAEDDTDIYFVANSQPYDVRTSCAFRITGKRPELWWPDTGRIEQAALYAEAEGGIKVPLSLGPSGSVFVVFHKSGEPGDPLVSVTRDGKPIVAASHSRVSIQAKKAVYGVLSDPQRTRDVRSKVQERLDRGETSFPVSQLAGGDDPAVNVLKTVDIEYAIEDQSFTVTGDDTDTIHLTGATPNIVIEKATYGILDEPQQKRDVRAKVQHIVDTGENRFEVAKLAQGDDPAPNEVKTLVVDYKAEGQSATATGTDPDTITLTLPDTSNEVATVHRGADGHFVLETLQPGRYELATASGKTKRVEVSDLPSAMELSGPWKVQFPPNWGAPETATLEKLISWSDHKDTGVKYFSGTASYTKAINVPGNMLGKDRRLYLDLGKVQVMAQVKLNGKDLGVIWKPPFRVDITDAARPGDNSLEVKVANLWINRLIGDEQLPEDSSRNPNGTLKEWPLWLNEGKPSPTGRFTFGSWRLWKKDDPLQESGLLGPVSLEPALVATW
jgi:hypothetical protein